MKKCAVIREAKSIRTGRITRSCRPNVHVSVRRRLLSYPGDLACMIITLDSANIITYTEIEFTCSNVIKDGVEENCDYDDY